MRSSSDEFVNIRFSRNRVAVSEKAVKVNGCDQWIAKSYITNIGDDGSIPTEVEASVPKWLYDKELRHNNWIKKI